MILQKRLAKLKAMPPREIAHRLKYRAYTALERQAHKRGQLARPDRLRAALATEIGGDPAWKDLLFERTSTGRYFAWEDDPDGIRERFRADYREELTRAREVADSVARYEISFFGQTFRFGPDVNWHADPVTGAEWPRRYHRDVPVEGGNAGFGDVKYVWELNRHQFLVDLAKVAFLDRSQRHATTLHSMLKNWSASVPYATGVPWACALEPAFRAWSWMWAYRMVRAAGLLDSNTHLLWLTGLYDHARFLIRHLERYSSPYNHLIGEASTLFALGLLLPEFREAPSWVTRGRTVLESTVSDQFHADGGSVEQSTFYHHATLGFYLMAAILGRRNGVELSSGVWNAVERGIEFSMLLVQPDGRLPRIGGADDGKPIRLEHLPLWDFRPYQALGASVFSRPDFKFTAGRFWEDALWILGCEGADTFDRLEAREPARAATLPASGYYVVRSDWSATADYLCFDCGEQAAGLRRDNVPSAAHGHADCLSVIAALAGQPVLVDPGFYCYNGARDWEVHFRKTAAHNTVSIDQRDQSQHVSKMAWTHTYLPHLESTSDDEIGWARGSHDGYADAGKGVIHRRTAWLRPGGYLVICDEISGRPGHTACANYQFAPGSLTLETDGALFANRFDVSWSCSVPITATRIQDDEGPQGGWIAPSLGVRERAPRLQLAFPLPSSRVVLLTIVADRTRAGNGKSRRICFSPVVRTQEDEIITARIDGGKWEDCIITNAAGRPFKWSGVETDANLAVLRLGATGVEDSRRIGGTYLRVRELDFLATLRTVSALANAAS